MRVGQKSDTFTRLGRGIVDEALKRGSVVAFGVVAVICLLIGYLLYSFVFSDMVTARDTYREQVVAKESENRRTEQMLAGEEQFLAKFNKIVSLYQEAKPLLPEETEVSDVLGQVETAAQRNGVVLTGLQAVKGFAKSTSSDKLYEREVPALVTGPYPRVMQFLNDVSKMPRILVIRDYDVSAGKDAVSVQFTLVAYHAPPPSEKPKQGQPAAQNAPAAPSAATPAPAQ